MNIPHDSFCRGVLSDVPTFLELLRYLTTRDVELNEIFKLLDESTFKRVPGDYSNTENTGYADLVFTAEVLQKFLTSKAKPVQVCVGFLVEHKSACDEGVMDQLCRYHYYLMENHLKANAKNGIPSVAIILYNGKDDWDPLKKLFVYPKELQRYLLPFKCILLNVKEISDETLDVFGARLAAFICAMKYIWNPEGSRKIFEKVLERIRQELPKSEALDMLLQMDVYLKGWLKSNFMEAFKMDFVRPNYKTVGDVLREEEEAAKKAAREEGARIGWEEGQKIGREEGQKIGREEGEKIGREEGQRIGRAEGEKAGAKYQAEKTARRMLAKNRPMDEIAEFSGLTEEQVRAL